MAKSRAPKARPYNEIVAEGMDVVATAPPVDPDDYSDVTSEEVESGLAAENEAATGLPPVGDVMQDRLAAALEALAVKNTQTPSGDDRLAAAMELMALAIQRMTEGQMKGSQLIADANKRAVRPENANAPMISVFNLRGEKDFPKPRLKCRMLLPWEAEEDSLDREEIELLNLLQAGEYTVVRNDRTKVKMRISIQTKLDSDEASILLLNHDTAFNNDYHRMLPPLTDILRQMLKQNPRTKHLANQVLTMDEEAALILTGQLNDGTVPENKRVVSVGE